MIFWLAGFLVRSGEILGKLLSNETSSISPTLPENRAPDLGTLNFVWAALKQFLLPIFYFKIFLMCSITSEM